MALVSNAEKQTLKEIRGQHKLNVLLSTPMFWGLILFFCFCFGLLFIENQQLAIYTALSIGFIIGVLTAWNL